MDKIGLHAQDTSELTFTDMRVPVGNLLEQEGMGFYQLVHNLPQERLALGVGAVAAAESIVAEMLDYVRGRKAFGSPIGSFQHSQFALAELATEIDIAHIYLDDCLADHLTGSLIAARAARLKWWTPTCRCAPPTAACNRTADTATCGSTACRGRSSTPASRRYTAEPTKS